MLDRARAQSGYRALRAPSRTGRDALRAYAWRRRADSVLRLADPIDAPYRQAVLRRAQSLQRILHLYESRTRDFLGADPYQLPSGDLALYPDRPGGIAPRRCAGGEAARPPRTTASDPRHRLTRRRPSRIPLPPQPDTS